MGLTLFKANSYALDDLVRSGSTEAFNLVAGSNSLHETLHPKHVPMLGIGVSKSDPHPTNPAKHPNRESFDPTLVIVGDRSTCLETKISKSIGRSSHEKPSPTDPTRLLLSLDENLTKSCQISAKFVEI